MAVDGTPFRVENTGSVGIAPLSEGYFCVLNNDFGGAGPELVVCSMGDDGVVTKLLRHDIATSVVTSASDTQIVRTSENHVVLYSEHETTPALVGFRWDPVAETMTEHAGTIAPDGLDQVSPRSTAYAQHHPGRDTGVISRAFRYNPEGYMWVGVEVSFREGDATPTRTARVTIPDTFTLDADPSRETPHMWLHPDGSWRVPLSQASGTYEKRLYTLSDDLVVESHIVFQSVTQFNDPRGREGFVFDYLSGTTPESLALLDMEADTYTTIIESDNPPPFLGAPVPDPGGGGRPLFFSLALDFPEAGTHTIGLWEDGAYVPVVTFTGDAFDYFAYSTAMLHDPIITGSHVWHLYAVDDYANNDPDDPTPTGSSSLIFPIGILAFEFGTGPHSRRFYFE